MVSEGEITACLPYNSETEDGCLAENCGNCAWTILFCKQCRQKEECEKRFLPKVWASNRMALNLFMLSRELKALPDAGGIKDQKAKLINQFEIIQDEINNQRKREKCQQQ